MRAAADDPPAGDRRAGDPVPALDRRAGDSVPAAVVSADGVRVAVHDLGGAGPTLILAHATSFCGRTWEPLAGHLAGDFRCVAPDTRGHGRSSAPPGLDLDWRGFATDLLATVEALGPPAPYGAGHSSGATALLLAEQARPGSFRALYCFEPILVPSEQPLGRDRGSLLAERARHRRAAFASRHEALRHLGGRAPLDQLHPDALRAYVDHGLETRDDGTAALLCTPEHEALTYEMATAHDCWQRLPEVHCPVTIVRGGSSHVGPPGITTLLAARLERLSTEELPGLGHLGPLQDPAAVAASIRRGFGRSGRD